MTAAASATLDLELQETGDLASQLSSREWLMSMPGTLAQKDQLDMQVDLDDNVWFTMTVPERASHFGFPTMFHPDTEEIPRVPIPSDGSGRFGDGAAQFLDLAPDGRLWFDTRTEAMHEFPTPRKWTTPYTASAPDKDGYVYAPSNMSERLMRLDPATGDVIEYQMPTDFDTKKILHDPSTDRTTLWMANTRNARLVRVEPLD